jgi:hypothetical protein
MTSAEFLKIYVASKHPDLRALWTIESQEARVAAARPLESRFLMSEEIDVQGWDPFTVESLWIRYGYTWVPSSLQNPIVEAPGLNDQHDPPYDPNNPPPGSVKVSIDPKDYLPFGPPPPPPPTDPTAGLSPVGSLLHDDVYGSKTWDHWAAGSVTGAAGVPSDPRGVFTKEDVPSIFFHASWWRKAVTK